MNKKLLRINKLNLSYRGINRHVYFIIILLFLSTSSFSQTRVDSLEYLGRYLNASFFNSRFDKQLNTFHLTNQLQLFKEFDDVVMNSI
jgi:hypothetical protein